MIKKVFTTIIVGFVFFVTLGYVYSYFPLLGTDFQAWYKADSVSYLSTGNFWPDSYWQDGRFDLQKGTGDSFVYTPNGMNFNPTLFLSGTELNNYHPDNISLQGEHKIFAVIKPYGTSGPINTIINGQCPNDQSCPRPDFYITAGGYPEYFAGAVGVDGSIPRYGIAHPMNNTMSIVGKPTIMSVQSNQTNPAWSYWVYDHPLSWGDGLNSRAFIKKNGVDIGVYEFLNNSQRDDSGIPREYNIGAGSKSANFGYQVGYDYLVGQEANLKPFQGEIAELIVYKGASNETAQSNSIRSVESYLAIKYGITLDQSGLGQHYIDGSGNIVWNATTNSGYNNNIFGIGRDDSTSLYQKQSQSVNTGVLTIALDQLSSTNQDNTSTLSDRNFIIGGDNNGSLILSDLFNGNINSRLGRVWKFEKIGTDTPLIEMIFTGIAPSGLSMIVSADEIFDMGDTILPLSVDRATYSPTSSIFYVSLISTPPTGYYPGPINYPIPGIKDHSLTISNVSGTVYLSTPVLTGTTAPNAFVTVTVSGVQYTGYADGSGNWSVFPTTLGSGIYTATVTAIVTGAAIDEYTTGTVTRIRELFVSGLSGPNKIAFDKDGNLYTTDGIYCAGNSISKITSGGIVSAFATLSKPCDLAFDKDGNLYVAQNTVPGNISKITSSGVVTSFVGGLQPGLNAIKFDILGNMYVDAWGSNTSIQKITPGGIISTFASPVTNPYGISFGLDGDLYVTQWSSNLMKISQTGAIFQYITGYNNIEDIIFDQFGNAYFATANNGIYKRDLSGGISIFSTGIVNITSIAFGKDGSLYATDRPGNSIYRIVSSQSFLTGSTTFSIVGLLPPPAPTTLYPGSGSTIIDITPTFSGTGSASGDIMTLTIYGIQYTGIVQSDLTWSITPNDIKLPDNRSYTISVTESNAGGTSPAVVETFRVQRYNPDTKDVNLTISNISGTVSCMLPSITGTATPGSTVVVTLSGYSFTGTADGSGNYNIPVSGNFSDGNYIVDTTVVVTGSALDSYTTGNVSRVSNVFATGLSLPIGITFNADNNIYIGNYGNDTVVTMSGGMPIPYANGFNHTVDIIFDIRGNLYVSNDISHTISKVNTGGIVSTFAGGFTGPHGLLYDSLGRMYVTNWNGNTISQLTTGGIGSTFISGLNKPEFMVFDTNNNIYVSNFGNNIISKITGLGGISNFSSGFGGSRGIAIDIFNNIYVANSTSNTISKITPSGVVTTFVASGLSGPFGMAFDNHGNLFVANPSNNTVSKITSQSTLTKSITLTKNCNAIVTFVDYDGTVLQTGTVQYGSSAVAPVNPMRTGYTFSGWNPSDLSNITGDTIFTGEYTINYYTLSFEENGGSNVLDQTGIVYNTTGSQPLSTKTGYIFSGWYMSGASTVFDFSISITGNTTLYAQRNIAKYNVTFVDHDGTILQIGIVQYGSSAVAPASPIRTGYIFSGWNPSDLSNIIGDTIFTGEYIHTVYTLSFDTVGGSSIVPITGYYMSGVIAPNNPIKVGYVFLGWNEIVPTNMPLGNKTFIAQRKPEIVSVTGYAGGGGGTPITPQPQPEEPKKPVVFENTDIYNTSIPNGYCYKRKSNVSIIDSLSIITTQEFKKSLTFLYAYDMTMFRSIDEFDPYRRLTREEAAKIFSNFAMNVLCRKPDKNLKISYSDVAESDPTLKNYITLAYQLGLMKGGRDDTFRPFDTITKAEFNAVLIRMILKSYLPEDTTDTWYTEYNDVSADLGIIKYGATEVPLIRNDATVMLFRAYKEQKFDLRMIDYETYVLDTRDEYLINNNLNTPKDTILLDTVSSVVSDDLGSDLVVSSGSTIEYTGSVLTGSMIRKNRPQRRI